MLTKPSNSRVDETILRIHRCIRQVLCHSVFMSNCIFTIDLVYNQLSS